MTFVCYESFYEKVLCGVQEVLFFLMYSWYDPNLKTALNEFEQNVISEGPPNRVRQKSAKISRNFTEFQ